MDELGYPQGVYGRPETPAAVLVSEVACHTSPGADHPEGSGPTHLTLAPALPNPFDHATSVTYYLPCHADAQLWLVKGVAPGERVPNPSSGGAVVSSPPLSRLVSSVQNAGPGAHRVIIDADALQLPDDFYRLYLRFGGALTWTDLWVNRSHP